MVVVSIPVKRHGLGGNVTTDISLVSRLRMNATTLFPASYAFMEGTGTNLPFFTLLRACSRKVCLLSELFVCGFSQNSAHTLYEIFNL